ncbi:hypothetical protein GOV05_03215 [Candidatus Woesearchaeota archaeon]|nr:hypothetical protein [Candidatus Woesearchaeota archaeon]
MGGQRGVFIVFLFLLFLQPVFCATLTGTVYDSNLNKVEKAVVEIRSPLQRDVVENGTYFFELSPGVYNISVVFVESAREESAFETVEVPTDNNYLFDLFLFTDLREVEELQVIPEINVDVEEKPSLLPAFLLILFLLLFFLGVVLYNSKRTKKVLVDELEDELKTLVVRIIKENNSRITQKELRKKVPYSEAKISLVISELESEGVLKKIKKGRANVLILKK